MCLLLMAKSRGTTLSLLRCLAAHACCHFDYQPHMHWGKSTQFRSSGAYITQATHRLVRLYVSTLIAIRSGPSAAAWCFPAHCKHHMSVSQTDKTRPRAQHPPCCLSLFLKTEQACKQVLGSWVGACHLFIVW